MATSIIVPAVIGGGIAAVTGGNVVKGAAMGAIGGGIANAVGGFAGGLGGAEGLAEGVGGAFDAAGVGTGIDAGVMASDAGLGTWGGFNSAAGLPLDAGGGMDMGASAGVFDSFGAPLYNSPSPSLTQSFTDPFKQGLAKVNSALGIEKNPITFGDIGKAGANYLVQSSLADRYLSTAEAAANRATALNQPQRFQYQNQLSDLLTNPQQFFSTNPAVQGQLDLARQQFQANTGKMGTGGTNFNDYLKNVQNIASGTFNDQAQLLGTLGGFNQGPGYAGGIFGTLAGQGLAQQQAMTAAFPDILNKVFGTPPKQTPKASSF